MRELAERNAVAQFPGFEEAGFDTAQASEHPSHRQRKSPVEIGP